ncbi:trans-sialidase [Trypanosoma rangeli]|uniref:Trans-sialidase n=1 Tax=Trypanosoma rangeli TaxID=5698 RepID=A0A422N7S5_TRYRA|nr:trans-sialidase [Trypanosoma rangeli]RNF01519.1 trans-sialidase [Trypanosoma rangeli]|eukprot:RNF01519.1 trans-sialidase [Trypanosoma rangeli]
MPKMSWHLFSSAFCFSPSACGRCASAAADQKDVMDPFQGATPKTAEWKEAAGASVTSPRLRSLLRIGDHLFAVAEAWCIRKKDGASFAGTASVLLHQISDSAKEIPMTDASLF